MRTRVLLAVSALVAAILLPAGPAGAAAAQRPTVLHLSQVTRQDVASQSGCEPDTVVEPDVAVSPLNPDIALAAAHDCRFSNGGAVTISVAWTHDGGATWHHQPVRGVTRALGGGYDRASDPVLAFAADGTAYLSILAFDVTPCPSQASAVVVLRSTDGGRSWSRPFTVQRAATCRVSDDKNWLVVDNSPASPYFGRLYQFWTPFISTDASATKPVGNPQVVRWSDDRGRTWSHTVYLTPPSSDTQNSQPMIMKDGTVVDTFYEVGHGSAPDALPAGRPGAAALDARRAIVNAYGPIHVSVSTNGGRTWTETARVTARGSGYAQNVRCCLFGADIDAQTGIMYVAFLGAGIQRATDPVFLSASRDGRRWTNPVQVSRGDVAGVQRVNVDVVARGGSVYVSYGTRTKPGDDGGFVQQQLSVSRDRGATFGAPLSIGRPSVLEYAARSEGYFPGDYIGEAITAGRLYIVWARSSKPPASSSSRYHQVIVGAALRP